MSAVDTKSAALGPFRIGQSWIIASESKTDKLVPKKTAFIIKDLLTERKTVIGSSVSDSGALPLPVQIELAENGGFSVADVSTAILGSKKIRICFFQTASGTNNVYTGTAAHYDTAQTKIDPDVYKRMYLTSHPKASDQEAGDAFIQAAAADDIGPCTLTLVK